MFAFDNLPGKLRSLTINRGSSDDAEVIVTMKIAVDNVPASASAYALGYDDAQSFVGATFRAAEDDSEQLPRALSIDYIKSAMRKETAHVLTIQGLPRTRASNLYDVRIKPDKAWMSHGEFVVTFHTPPESFIEDAAKLVKHRITVTLEQDPELPLEHRSSPQQDDIEGDERARRARQRAH